RRTYGVAEAGSRILRLSSLGKSPIHDERFTILSQHDVVRLQVAVQHAAAMSVGDRVTDFHEACEELAQSKGSRLGGLMILLDGLLQVLPTDEAHRVEGSAIGVAAKTVDGNDPRMLQAASDLRFHDEARTTLRQIGMTLLDFFQRDLAVQLFIHGHGYSAQSAFRMRAKDAVTRTGRRQTDSGQRFVTWLRGDVIFLTTTPGNIGQARAHVGIVDLF